MRFFNLKKTKPVVNYGIKKDKGVAAKSHDRFLDAPVGQD